MIYTKQEILDFVKDNLVIIKGEYANNTASLTAGLEDGDIYNLPIASDNLLLAVVKAGEVVITTNDAGATLPFSDGTSFVTWAKGYSEYSGTEISPMNGSLVVTNYLQIGNVTHIFCGGFTSWPTAGFSYISANIIEVKAVRITTIADEAFESTTSLTKVEFPLVTNIGFSAFRDTKSIDPTATMSGIIHLDLRSVTTFAGDAGNTVNPASLSGMNPVGGWTTVTVIIPSALLTDPEIGYIQGQGANIITV